MKRFTAFVMAFLLALCVLSASAEESLPASETERETIGSVLQPGNAEAFVQLLLHLLGAYENPDVEDSELLKNDLQRIGENSDADLAVALAVAEHWQKVYLDPDYRLYMYGEGDPAASLERSGIPQGRAHAFAVLGYELQDGQMTEELTGRCRAAAAAADAFPDSVLVLTGGATGPNNPEGHTEAGLMKQYLTEQCGISEDRIFTDEKAMTTAQNALYTYGLLQDNGIETLTLVTSSYHQRWAQVLYNAVGALYRRQYGSAARLTGNYCWDTEPSQPLFRQDARIALMQLAGILGLPETLFREMIMPRNKK